jgi:hypothetical protein
MERGEVGVSLVSVESTETGELESPRSTERMLAGDCGRMWECEA